MKPSKKATVVDAARALLEVCDGAGAKDGQGFNRIDSPIARSICSQNFITPKQASLLHKILKKYQGQLEGLGFDHKKLDVPKTFTKYGGEQPTWKAAPAPHVEPPPARVASALTPWALTGEALLGHFPPGFTPRPQQKIALEKIAAAYSAGKRVVVLEMPTGGGKTHTAKAVANAAVARGGTLFLTSQKILQDQYEADYPSPDMETLKGRSNYSCSHEAGEGNNCADAPCTRKRKGILAECVNADQTHLDGEASPMKLAVSLALKPDEHLCPYWKQLQKCYDHKITLFNFSSFLFQQRLERFPKRGLMILDEAHGTEGQLMAFVSLELTEWALSIVDVRITRDIASKEQFAEWLRETDLLRKIDKLIKDASEDNEDAEELDKVQLEALKELQGKVATFLAFIEKTEWILEVVEYEKRGEPMKKIVARPLFAKNFAHDLLFRHADRLLCMSATILDVNVWAENLGLDRDEIELVQTPCDFPIENRPINLDYAGNAGYKFFSPRQNPTTPTRPKFAAKVAFILNAHKGQRGIIHSQSFDLARALIEDVRSSRFLFQEDFESKDEMLTEHARRKDSVLVAPAMHEGLDLKDDLCLAAGTKIMMGDLSWRSVEDVLIGDRVIAIDEQGGSHYAHRKLKYATVKATGSRIAEVFEVETTHGSILATKEHPMLIRMFSKRTRWAPVEDLVPGWKIRWVAKPTIKGDDWTSGYLSGFFDGEGCLFHPPRGLQITVVQKEGPALRNIQKLLQTKGFRYRLHMRPCISPRTGIVSKGLVGNVVLQGYLSERLRFLSEIRPERLISKLDISQLSGRDAFCAVIKGIRRVGKRRVYNLSTTEKTYIANGFAVHNCRFSVIAKVPWPSLGDKVTKERASRDDRYYSYLTALKICQSYGRGVRSKDDWSTTYIIDQGFDGFVARHGKTMLPKWFMDAVLRGAAMRIAREEEVPF